MLQMSFSGKNYTRSVTKAIFDAREALKMPTIVRTLNNQVNLSCLIT